MTQGVLRIILESSCGRLETFYIGKDSGVVEVPPFRRHRIRRGDLGGKWEQWMQTMEFKEGGKIPRDVWDEEVKSEEWTSPADGQKEVFLRNLGSVVSEPQRAEGFAGKLLEITMVTANVFIIMRELDSFPAFLGGRWRRVEWWLSHFVLWVASFLGRALGARGEWEEYTPVELSSRRLAEERKKVL